MINLYFGKQPDSKHHISKHLHSVFFEYFGRGIYDGIFAALTLHLFYRNSDIVEFAMETQLCNLLQSLFETSGGKCYRTPTYYAMKLLRDHLEQDLIKVLPDSDDDMLDAVASLSNDRRRLTISMVNKDLNSPRIIVLNLPQGKWKIIKSDIITAGSVRLKKCFLTEKSNSGL